MAASITDSGDLSLVVRGKKDQPKAQQRDY
jgi:hypothetical protein